MPAVPVYTASPVNAAKASGPTPQTAQQNNQAGHDTQATTTMEASSGQESGYPAAQAAAMPQVPVQTGAPQPGNLTNPTPTTSYQPHSDEPPAPQPGAVPVAPASHLPPPPKAGEAPQPTATGSLPPQMSYPPPTAQFPAPSAATTTSTAPPPMSPGGPMPISLQEAGPAPASYTHPPGYRQDSHAGELTSSQRAAHNANVEQDGRVFSTSGDDDDEGLWGTAKKWANAAGSTLAAAEGEVWRRINKD